MSDQHWTAQSEDGCWTVIPRTQENPTRRNRIEAAEDMRDAVGWGYDSFRDFIDLVNALEPIKVIHYTGVSAREMAAESGFSDVVDDWWEESDNGNVLAWCVR